jgi:hypothetical protein
VSYKIHVAFVLSGRSDPKDVITHGFEQFYNDRLKFIPFPVFKILLNLFPG